MLCTFSSAAAAAYLRAADRHRKAVLRVQRAEQQPTENANVGHAFAERAGQRLREARRREQKRNEARDCSRITSARSTHLERDNFRERRFEIAANSIAIRLLLQAARARAQNKHLYAVAFSFFSYLELCENMQIGHKLENVGQMRARRLRGARIKLVDVVAVQGADRRSRCSSGRRRRR